MTMTDELRVLSLINDNNVPNKVQEHLFAGEFRAEYDNVVIKSVDKDGYERSITYNNVVIESEVIAVC